MSNIEMRLYGDSVEMIADIHETIRRMLVSDSYNHREERLTRGDGSVVYFRTVSKPKDSDRLSGMIWQNTYLHSSFLEAHPYQREVRDEVMYLLSRQRSRITTPLV